MTLLNWQLQGDVVKSVKFQHGPLQPSFYIHSNQLQDQYTAESKHQDLPQPLLILTLQDGWTMEDQQTHGILNCYVARSVYFSCVSRTKTGMNCFFFSSKTLWNLDG